MKTALVLANLRSPNVGNGALVSGTINSLNQSFPHKKFNYSYYAWDDVTFSNSIFPEDFYISVNRRDLLIVPGAVTFNGKIDHSRGGSRLNFTVDDLERIKCPLLLQGLSYRYWSTEPYPNVEKLRQLIDYLMLRPNCAFGVRNDGTKEWLTEVTKMNLDALTEVPDPGLFTLSPRERSKRGENLFVSVNYEDAECRYSSTSDLENILEGISIACERFASDTTENIVFVPHSFEDYEMMLLVFKRLKPRTLHQRVRILGMPSFDSHMEIYRAYESARAVISMRVHSMSPSLGLGVPTMVISSQQRLTKYMENLGLKNQVIEMSSPNLGVSLLEFIDEARSGHFQIDETYTAIENQQKLTTQFHLANSFLND
jgi:hypothetical protein